MAARGGDNSEGTAGAARPLATNGGARNLGGAANLGGTGQDGAAAAGAASTTEFRVVGYVTSWSGDIEALPFSRLTHVNFAFAAPKVDGGLMPVDNEAKLDQLVTAAHAHGVQVLLSLGGWNDGDDRAFHALAKTEATRIAFANTVLEYVMAHQLDGADIDWEYPDVEQEAPNYTDLVARLAARLHPQGKLVTSAWSASSSGTEGIAADVFPYLDFVTLMAYDGGDGESGATHSPYSYAVSALDFWLGTKGLPPQKAVLGVPFYARPSSKSYAEIVAADPSAAQRDQANGEYYNGIPTIEAKTALARERASGVMIWELSQDTSDDTSLLSAIDRVVSRGAAPSK